MAFNIGINVIETDGSASPAIAGAPTSVTGLILRARRGPTDKAVRVSNFRQFVARFGGYDRNFVGAYSVDGFFLNGGQEAYIARVVNSKDETVKAASVTLRDRLGNNTLTASAGYRGTAEIGAWGNDLYLSTQDNPEFSTPLKATLTGNQPARLLGNALKVVDLSPFTGTSPRTLNLRVDGAVSPLNITFSQLPVPSKATLEDILAAINLQGGSKVKAVEQTGGILLVSHTKGASSQVEIVDSIYEETRNRLGFVDGKINATGQAAQAAQLQGSPLPEPVDLSSSPGSSARTLTLLVDNEPALLTVNFGSIANPAQATAQVVVDAINARIGAKVTASAEADKSIKLTSNITGANSRIQVVTDDTPSLLGFPPDKRTNSGADIANSAYNQVQVESISSFRKGDWVRLSDGITESWHQITEIPPPRDSGTGTLQYFVHWDTPPNASDRNEYRAEDGARLSTSEFDLIVSLLSPANPKPQTVETWSKLTLDQKQSNYAPSRINDLSSGSAYIVLQDVNPNTFNGSDTPALVQATPLAEGNDGGTTPATGDYVAALSRFDAIDVQLLAVPEVLEDGVSKAITRSALDYCGGKGDCIFVGHTPLGRDAEGAKAFGQDFRAAKVYGALYWPWITVTDPIGSGSNPTRVVPPTGHVLGVYARIDQTRGVWKAPAGNEAVVRGALAVEQNITDVDHTDLVKNGSVNGIRQIRGTGIVLDASRTLSTDTRWLYVNVRLLFNYVKVSLREGLRWVKQEPNRDSLWNTIKYNVVTPFLLRLHQAGAFGTGTPAQVFTVICSAENNPPSEVDLGNLRVEVYFYPAKPAETILIIVGQQESGATTSER